MYKRMCVASPFGKHPFGTDRARSPAAHEMGHSTDPLERAAAQNPDSSSDLGLLKLPGHVFRSMQVLACASN